MPVCLLLLLLISVITPWIFFLCSCPQMSPQLDSIGDNEIVVRGVSCRVGGGNQDNTWIYRNTIRV